MLALSHYLVVADVRLYGTDRNYEKRSFDLMLNAFDTAAQREAEAKRIVRQIGYAFRNLKVKEER